MSIIYIYNLLAILKYIGYTVTVEHLAKERNCNEEE